MVSLFGKLNINFIFGIYNGLFPRAIEYFHCLMSFAVLGCTPPRGLMLQFVKNNIFVTSLNYSVIESAND